MVASIFLAHMPNRTGGQMTSNRRFIEIHRFDVQGMNHGVIGFLQNKPDVVSFR